MSPLERIDWTLAVAATKGAGVNALRLAGLLSKLASMTSSVAVVGTKRASEILGVDKSDLRRARRRLVELGLVATERDPQFHDCYAYTLLMQAGEIAPERRGESPRGAGEITPGGGGNHPAKAGEIAPGGRGISPPIHGTTSRSSSEDTFKGPSDEQPERASKQSEEDHGAHQGSIEPKTTNVNTPPSSAAPPQVDDDDLFTAAPVPPQAEDSRRRSYDRMSGAYDQATQQMRRDLGRFKNPHSEKWPAVYEQIRQLAGKASCSAAEVCQAIGNIIRSSEAWPENVEEFVKLALVRIGKTRAEGMTAIYNCAGILIKEDKAPRFFYEKAVIKTAIESMKEAS